MKPAALHRVTVEEKHKLPVHAYERPAELLVCNHAEIHCGPFLKIFGHERFSRNRCCVRCTIRS